MSYIFSSTAERVFLILSVNSYIYHCRDLSRKMLTMTHYVLSDVQKLEEKNISPSSTTLQLPILSENISIYFIYCDYDIA